LPVFTTAATIAAKHGRRLPEAGRLAKEVIMTVRTATAKWTGNLKAGNGKIHIGNEEKPYSFASRFEDGDGTNPEELIAAAHAGCFSMALSHGLAEAGYTPDSVETEAKVHLQAADGGFEIPTIEISTDARVPNIDEGAFQRQAQTAKESCPVSKALAGCEIKLTANLKP
jgi:osmotically inducible protein OsmC